MLPTLQHSLRGILKRVRQRRFAARFEHEIQTCNSVGGTLALVLIAMPAAQSDPEAEGPVSRTAEWIAAAYPGVLVDYSGSGTQIAVLLPGASLARAQQFCEQLHHTVAGPGPVGECLVTCVQGLAGWEPGLTAADLWRHAGSALRSALSARLPVVLYHDSMSRRPDEVNHLSWDDWSV